MTLASRLFGIDPQDPMNPLIDRSEYKPQAFDEWRWMVHEGSTPLALTVFGDWIYSDGNAVYLCSPTANDNYEIATVAEEIDWSLEDADARAPWVLPGLLRELEHDGIIREPFKMFHFVTPLFLGGATTKSNIQQLDISQYFQGMLKLLRQMR